MSHFFRFLLIGFLLSLQASTHAQETTFHRNGPDDYREGVHAFTNATIYKNYNTKVEHATLLIKDGKVVDAGANVTIPKGAIVHDLKGKFIYPSFIDIYSSYGLPEVKKQGGNGGPQMETNVKGAYGWNQALHPDYSAIKNFVADDKKADDFHWHFILVKVFVFNVNNLYFLTGFFYECAEFREKRLILIIIKTEQMGPRN